MLGLETDCKNFSQYLLLEIKGKNTTEGTNGPNWVFYKLPWFASMIKCSYPSHKRRKRLKLFFKTDSQRSLNNNIYLVNLIKLINYFKINKFNF